MIYDVPSDEILAIYAVGLSCCFSVELQRAFESALPFCPFHVWACHAGSPEAEMIIEVANGDAPPVHDGLYLVFVDSAAARGWTEPHIVLRQKGKWCHRNSEIPYLDKIRAWAVLQPMASSYIQEQFAPAAPVYDL